MRRARQHSGNCVRDRELSIVMTMNAYGYARLRHAARWKRAYQQHHLTRRCGDEFRQAAAVGIAQDDPLWSTRQSRLQRSHRIFRVCAITIKVMFSVVDHERYTRGEIGDGVSNNLEVLLRFNSERISDVQQP